MTPGRTGSSLGYQQEAQQGPWLIGAVIRWIHRNTRTVEWDLIDEIADGEIRLKPLTGN